MNKEIKKTVIEIKKICDECKGELEFIPSCSCPSFGEHKKFFEVNEKELHYECLEKIVNNHFKK